MVCALSVVVLDGKNEVDDEKFQRVFVKSALKLRSDQAPKAQPPLPVRLSNQRTSVVGHAGAPTHSKEATEIERS